MKFYSYDYVLSQISQQNWVTIGIDVYKRQWLHSGPRVIV